MKLLPLLFLLAACQQQRIVTQYDYYPEIRLDRTIGKDGMMVNRPVTMRATYEVTRWAETGRRK